MPFFVYIIKCLQDGTYYKGSIENYLQRLNYQNAGKSRYISAKVPWKLIYDEEKPDK
jgi:predicted GIY-YIG superfamily endonuclease